MENSNILKPSVTEGKGIVNKLLFFLCSWLLTEIVILGSFFNFIDRLNENGILGMGADFLSSHLFWGVHLSMNILKIILLSISACLFGLMYGYLSKKNSLIQNIVINIYNSFFSVFGFIIVFIVVLLIFSSKSTDYILNRPIEIIVSHVSTSSFFFLILLSQLFSTFAAGFFFVRIGASIRKNTFYNLDNQSGTFLGIKWYHYFWLWITISAYCQIFLNLIYATGYTVLNFIRNVKLIEWFGDTSSDSINGHSSFDIAWGKLFIIYLSAFILLLLLNFLRKVLSGEKRFHWSLKILFSVVIGFIIPVTLTYLFIY